MEYHNSKEARPTDASACPINLPLHPDRKVVARFDGGRLSSDAGLVCVWALDQQQSVTQDFAACIRDVRDGRYLRHEIGEMATQRSFQIVAGYEDCNDADTGDLITALLRPGNFGAASGVVSVLKRLVKKMRRRLEKKIEIEIRADSWEHPRRMLPKVEVTDRGVNRRFVVTNRADLSLENLYEHYVDRGQAENFVKAFKKDLAMDRRSCHRFLANQVEIWFNLITQQAIRRGTFHSVKDLTRKIDLFVSHYNSKSTPFVWTATADSILQKINRLCQSISGTLH